MTTTWFTTTADLSQATAPRAVIMRRLLKVLGSTFGGGCLWCDVTPLDGEHGAGATGGAA